MNRVVPSQPDFGERPYFQPLFKPVHFGYSTSERREMPRLPDAPQPTSPLLPDHPHHPKYISDRERVFPLSWRSELKRRLPYRPPCRSPQNASFQNYPPYRRWRRDPHPSSNRTPGQKPRQNTP